MQQRHVVLVDAGPWRDGRLLIGRGNVVVSSLAIEAFRTEALPERALVVFFANEALPILAFLRTLRGDPRHLTTEAVIAAPEALRDVAMSAGATAFLPTPCSIAEFRDEVFPLLGLTQRRYARVPCDVPVEVNSGAESTVCRVVDLSEGGCYITACDRPLQVGASCHVRLAVGDRRVSLWAKIVAASTRQVRGATVDGFGVAFIDKDPDVRRALSSWVAEQLAALGPDQHKPVSLPLSFGDRALLAALDSVRVATLGLRDRTLSNVAQRLLPHEWTAVCAPLETENADAWVAVAVALREHLRAAQAERGLSMDLIPVLTRVQTYLTDLKQHLQGDGRHLEAVARDAIDESLLLMLREFVRLRDYYQAVRMPEDPDFLPAVERAEDYMFARARIRSDVVQGRKADLRRAWQVRPQLVARWVVVVLALIGAWAVVANLRYLAAPLPEPEHAVWVLNPARFPQVPFVRLTVRRDRALGLVRDAVWLEKSPAARAVDLRAVLEALRRQGATSLEVQTPTGMVQVDGSGGFRL